MTPNPPQALTTKESIDALWKVIGRYDTYIGSTNTKAAMLIAFSTFVPGSVALKWLDIRVAFGPGHAESADLAAVLLLVACAAAIVTLVFTFRAINPFLGSPKKPGGYHSNLFFEHVAEHSPDDYLNAVLQMDDSTLQRDVAYQANALAKGLNAKFKNLKWAILAAILQLGALMGLVALFLFAITRDTLAKTSQG